MHKLLRPGVVAVALMLSVSLTTACEALLGAGQQALQAVGEIKGDFTGTVKDPDGKGIAGATIKVYKNSEIGNVTRDAGGGNFVVDLDKLTQNKPSIPETTSDSQGNWSVKDLKVAEGPYVIVATNKRGSDFRGIDRDTRKLFSFQFTTPDKLPEFSANSAVFPNPTKATSIDFMLPAETPPAPRSEDEAPPPTIPATTSAPAPQNPADEVQQTSGLPKPNTAAVSITNLRAVRADGSEIGAALKTEGSDGFVLYDLKELESTTKSNKFLIKADASANVTSATLLVSHIDRANKAKINEVPVVFRNGKLATEGGPADGYLFAVPRDGGKTVLQVRSGETYSNAIALDTSKMNTENIRPITVILTWDKGGGTDIDLHTVDLDTYDESWFGDLALPNGKGSLDLDNTEGYGPETFTGKKGRYAVSINYWFGTVPTTVKVRVITATDDKTYQKTLRHIGEWWDVGEFSTTD